MAVDWHDFFEGDTMTDASDNEDDWFKEYMGLVVSMVKEMNATMLIVSNQVRETHDSAITSEKCVREYMDTFSKRMFWLIAGVLSITAGVFCVKLIFPTFI